MKKYIALLLALVMCLSLCACGGGEPDSTGSLNVPAASTAAQNDPTVTATAPSFSTEPVPSTVLETTVPETSVPTTTAPQQLSVEITMDNWQEYFEFRSYKDLKFNAFGGREDTWIYYDFITKDGIVPVVSECNVAMEAKHIECSYFAVSYDNATKEFTMSERREDYVRKEVFDMSRQKLHEETEYNRYGAYLGAGIIFENKATTRENWEITRIQGTLTFIVHP